jgi:hypothetical protein
MWRTDAPKPVLSVWIDFTKSQPKDGPQHQILPTDKITLFFDIMFLGAILTLAEFNEIN